MSNSRCHDYSTVAATARFLFNSPWHDYSTVTGIINQQSLARFFHRGLNDSSIVTGKIFSFFYASSILQQCCSLLKNRAMYQEYNTWSGYWYMTCKVFFRSIVIWELLCMVYNTPIFSTPNIKFRNHACQSK